MTPEEISKVGIIQRFYDRIGRKISFTEILKLIKIESNASEKKAE